ncbi:MAG: cytochrome ubiquinol oxidase subunit I [Myxococcales bacterium]|nr:cytochrome ubiquinol oxidase subunit I [Myxococcales bacterium]
MNVLTAARAQMEVSLAFHMVFAAVGIAMPILMLVAEDRAIRTGDPGARALSRRMARVTALLFAVGAVSGTALSFELSLLWPGFMRVAGPAIGPAFALEGDAFFLEAIFLGLYLYGHKKLSPRAHWWTGVPVAVSGLLSGAFVVAVNAWMQCPPEGTGVTAEGLVSPSPWAPFLSPAWVNMAVHSTLACTASVGFAVAGVAAAALRRGDTRPHHPHALRIGMGMAAVSALAQLVSGDFIAKMVARTQPVKLAAMEAHFETARGAAVVLGGVVDSAEGRVHHAVTVPKVLSVLAFGDPAAEVRGLNSFDRALWPNVNIVHIAFDVMVGCGSVMALVALVWGWFSWRGRGSGAALPRWVLSCIVWASPLGFVALEAGWIVTEAGRQPWVIQGLLRTRDAVTREPSAALTFWGFSLLYLGLGVAVVLLLRWFGRAEVSDHHGDAATEGELRDGHA